MDAVSVWLSDFGQATFDALRDVGRSLPSLAAAILILIAGWILARFSRGLVRRLSNRTNRLLDRVFRHGALSRARISPVAMAAVGEIAFWTILFLTVTVAARIAGFAEVAGLLNDIASLLPNLLLGAAIIAAGYVTSVLVGEQVASMAHAAKAGQGELMGKFAQAAIFVAALIIGLGQIGVDVTFLIALVTVSVGAVLLGFSIAFGFGARDYVGNLLGARTARRVLSVGLSVRIGDVEGEILEITPTQIALDTASGRTLVPARLVDEQNIVIIAADSGRTPADG
jgi:hypothetical protein